MDYISGDSTAQTRIKGSVCQKMPFSSSAAAEMDSALDALGASLLDGIPVEINPRFLRPDRLLREVDSLLSAPTPGEDGISRGVWHYDGAIERQVMAQLEAIDKEKEEREKKLNIYREQNEKELKEIEEERQRKKEEEEAKKEPEDTLEDEEPFKAREKPATAPEPIPSTTATTLPSLSALSLSNGVTRPAPPPPPQFSAHLRQPASTPPQLPPRPSRPPTSKPNINLSEFEAELNPFDSLALKSIDDKQELAAILQTSTSSTTTATSTSSWAQFSPPPPPPPYPPAAATRNPFLQNYYIPQQQQSQFQQGMSYAGGFTSSGSSYLGQRPSQVQPPQQQSSPLKSSKSYGDLVSELKKEGDRMSELKKRHQMQQQQQQQQIAIHSVTPPPRISLASKGLENWVPWPELEQSRADPLQVLSSQSERTLCKQIAEMGFPLDRVIRICQVKKGSQDLGQTIINFCLLVDKFSTAEGFDAAEAEHVLMLKSMDEDATRKHLTAFRRLKDLGFPAKNVHDALVEAKSDHDKALELLLK